ncbi:MAG: hypothetical protein CME70_07590 [Halobacteriovorax sp.]|nr:hypothetical protein [Halobacteriovorax sp.]|tara:strand:- start:319627 stop:321510 length:1884 start_codon:yes stop_codon:yes gene_type:complete
MSQINKLEELIKYHKALYYQGRPEINDLEYDKLEEELRKLDPKNKTLQIVGTTTTGTKVKHNTKMLSLNKTYKIEELEKWAENKEVVSTLKIDGVSCSIIFEDGILNLGKTRGDGSFGEDITDKLLWIKSIPKKLVNSNQSVEIRGELFCTESDFFSLTKEMVKIGLEKPTSQRNIVAGLISRKENIELCRYIQFRAFDIIAEDIKIKSEKEKETILKKMGFIPEEFTLHENIKTIKEEVERARLFMSEGDYQIDGLVFTYNEYSLHKELGATAHHPRYKIAFKYQGDTKETVIEDITWQVSRNGILTPVAEVTPIDLSGAKISRVTLHNYGMVNQYELKKGDTIEIVRSGEVIPKFLSVIKRSKGKVVYPKTCPSCNEGVSVVDIRILCTNPTCPAQVKEGILNFVQKIGIDDLSSKRLEEMISKGIVSKIEDLYKIKKNDLLVLDKFKEKLEGKLLTNISNSKNTDLATFLSALGISGGAINKCEKVVHSGINTIEKILDLKLNELVAVEGFAEKSATDFLESLQTKHETIKNLVKLGFSFKSENKKTDGALTGLKIAITGTLSEKRTVIESKIKESGGVLVSSVSKKTDILLTNQQTSSSSKYKKATELGIKILSEEELLKLLS